MNPQFVDEMSWEMAEVYGSITDQILINLSKYFPFYKPGDHVPRSSFEYQARMLAQMGKVTNETIRIITNGLGGANSALVGVLEAAIMESVRKAEPELLKGVKQGLLRPKQPPVVAPNQMQAFNLYYNQASQKLNLVNTVMLESTKSAYQQAISGVVADIELADTMNRLQIAMDTAAGETITGVSSWNTALKHATDRMKETGITGFIDHAGHHWSAEAYAAMDIRTTVANTARAAVWETNQNFGNDLYLVSYHNGARPLCYDWQNKVISANGNAGVTYDLDGNEIRVYAQSETTYGEPAGLFGINCKHYPSPFIPGVSLIRGEPQDKETNDRVYAESQYQRGLERKIREEKRDLLMMKAQGASKELLDAQRAKIRQTDDDIDAFCAETGRARRQNREGVYTKREFPSKDSYDVSLFEHEQKDIIDKYFRDGGAQQNYTFGQMTPNVPIAPAPVTPVAPTPQIVTPQVTPTSTVDGKIDKLKGTMSQADYESAVKLIDQSPTAKLYETYGDSCDSIARIPNGGRYRRGYDRVEWDYATSNGMSRFSTMAHEMAHMFDAKIGRTASLTFSEVDAINSKCVIGSGATKLIRVVPSVSDEFLSAMRKDRATLESILSDLSERGKMRQGSWRNASAGVQDAIDGFFGTWDKGLLPWGHGDRYYNRWYNQNVKDRGLDKDLKQAFLDLGFGTTNQAAVKKKSREYETANELWANVLSAITCGGEELDAFRQYMPSTVDAAMKILGVL